ncbi:MAG TPA: condensation domain-containing protein, partial [Pyrinomonadaceae bacterium]
MGAKNVEDVYPLSPMQEGLLFHSLYAQDHAVYVTHITCTLENLDVPAFERAWQQVMDRHPALRTAFVWQNLEKPLQVVTRRVRIRIDQLDWRAFSREEQDARLKEFLQSEQNHDFKLSKAPLVRLTLFQTGANAFQFVYSHHHLLLDGWSDYLLLNEVFTFYEAFHAGRELHLEMPRPYRDYIAWLGQQDLSQAESFWRQLLQGFNSPTVLGVDQSPSSLPSQDETTIYFRLPVEITNALRTQARRQGLTLNTLTQGVWALLLSRYSGERDVVFGATVSGRPIEMKGVEKMMGVFINTLPVRVRVPSNVSVLAWLRELQLAQLAMRQYEYSPLVQIQGWSDVPRGTPLFDTILDFENHTAGTSLEELG